MLALLFAKHNHRPRSPGLPTWNMVRSSVLRDSRNRHKKHMTGRVFRQRFDGAWQRWTRMV